MKQFDLSAYAAAARRMVTEGCVLLRNVGQVLPLGRGEKIAVFGRSQFHYYKSGTGSGGLVNTAPVAGITEALEKSGAVQVDPLIKGVYENWLSSHPFNAGVGWASEPWFQEEMPLEDDLVAQARSRNDAAVIVIGRTAGEDQDNSDAPGSWRLTKEEESLLAKVCGAFSKTVVVLNVGNIIDMSWVEVYRPSAVLYVWQGGQEGGWGTADVLTGAAAPGGHLSDTIARGIGDYPAAANYGSETRNLYAEDIYVGYRYFQTFAPEKVLYPFGFGLSYTTFSAEPVAVTGDGKTVRAEVRVTNTGSVAGRQVVQLYCEKPQGKLGQPARTLCAFEKTKALAPGQSETLSLQCAAESLASFDDSGAVRKNAWVLEKGVYRFCLGTDVVSAKPVLEMALEETVVEQLEEACAPVTPFRRMKPGGKAADRYLCAWEEVPQQEEDPGRRRLDRLPEGIPYGGDKGITLSQVAEGKAELKDFLSQLTDEDLATLVRGEGMCSPRVTPGTGGAFGGVSDRLVGFGIPAACCSDGPSGIRMDCGTRAFALPNGTCQACSFDTELVEELYEYEGLELRKNKIDTLLGPGINIHRHPLNGRNFEYFSEDPLLTGRMAAAQLRGMHRYGVTGTVKHFACNNQEFHRHDVDSVVSQRALREIYLKGFEIAVKEGAARCIMSSYNPVNGIWTSGNYDLLTTVLRKEWGYQGLVMSDWWAKSNSAPGEPGEKTNMAAMIRAQNDLYMVTTTPAENTNGDNSLEALEAGTVTRAEYLRSAENRCRVVMGMPCMTRLQGIPSELDELLEKAPSLDGTEDAPMYLAEPDEKNHIILEADKIGRQKGDSTRFTVALKEGGMYILHLTLRSTDANDVAQLPLSLFQDRNLLQTVTLNGSERDWKTVDIQVASMNTFYLRFYAGQSGLEIRSCDLEFIMGMAELRAMYQRHIQENKNN